MSKHPEWTTTQDAKARALHATGADDIAIGEALDRSAGAIKSWRKRVRLVKRGRCHRFPEPADFATYFATNSVEQCASHWGVSEWTVRRWARDAGFVKEPVKKQHQAAPDHFTTVAVRLTIKEAMAHFDRGEHVIRRWYKASGIKPDQRSSPKVGARVASWGAPASPMRIEGDGTLAGQAAHYLRRTHANVFRASVLEGHERKDLPNGGRGHYFVSGKGFLTVEAMIALAEAKGFGRAVAA